MKSKLVIATAIAMMGLKGYWMSRANVSGPFFAKSRAYSLLSSALTIIVFFTEEHLTFPLKFRA